MRPLLITISMAWCFSTAGFAAGDIKSLEALANAQFENLSKDLTAAASYKGVIPAESLGLIGVDVGVEVTGTQLEYSGVWENASGGNEYSKTLLVPKLHAHKGLPFGLDVGLMLATVPESNVRLIGGEVRYALIGGNVAFPALAARLSHTRLMGVEQLDFNSTGVDISVSKGLLMLTPYAGIGKVFSTTTPNGVPLTEQTQSLDKVFAGANLNLGLINFGLEWDKTGDATSGSLKLGFRF